MVPLGVRVQYDVYGGCYSNQSDPPMSSGPWHSSITALRSSAPQHVLDGGSSDIVPPPPTPFPPTSALHTSALEGQTAALWLLRSAPVPPALPRSQQLCERAHQPSCVSACPAGCIYSLWPPVRHQCHARTCSDSEGVRAPLPRAGGVCCACGRSDGGPPIGGGRVPEPCWSACRRLASDTST